MKDLIELLLKEEKLWNMDISIRVKRKKRNWKMRIMKKMKNICSIMMMFKNKILFFIMILKFNKFLKYDIFIS